MDALRHAYDVLASSGMNEGLPADDVAKLLCASQRCADMSKRFKAYYLVEMDERRLYQTFGCSSTRHFAQQHMDQDHRRTGELLQVGRALLTLPAIDTAFCNHEISWSKLRCLVRVVVPKHEAAWLTKAKELSCKALSREVLLSKEGTAPRKPGQRKGLAEIRYPVRYSLDVLTHEKYENAMRKLSDEFGHQLTGPEFMAALCDMALASTPDGSIPGRNPVNDSLYKVVINQDANDGLTIATADGPMPVDAPAQACDAECLEMHGEVGANGAGKPKDRKTPTWLRIAVIQRDGNRCRNCGCSRSLMVHHIDYREDGGPTKASNLITVCERCHGLVHDGLILIDGNTSRAARFLEVSPQVVAPPNPSAALSAHVRRSMVTLDAVPAEIDSVWWDAHSHLIESTSKGLTFTPGEARSEAASEQNGARAPRARPSSLRADTKFENIDGQDRVVESLSISAQAAKVQGRPFPHTLLSGQAGTGKTMLARAIAHASDSPLIEAQCPLLQNPQALLGLLCQLREGDALFLDEIDALPKPLLETLYQAMAEGCVTLTLRDGLNSRTVRLQLPRFTLLAATTEHGDLPNALLSRFGLCERLVRYEDEAIARIASRSATQLGLQLTIGAALVLAQRARGIPRKALSLLGRVHENAICDGTDMVNSEVVLKTLTRLGYDADGHSPDEQQYLQILARSRGAMPLHRLCSLMGESVATVTKSIEPYLFEAGLVATSRAGRHLATPAIGGGAWRVRERTQSLRPTRAAQAPRALQVSLQA